MFIVVRGAPPTTLLFKYFTIIISFRYNYKTYKKNNWEGVVGGVAPYCQRREYLITSGA